ncbi:hypothetical protein CKY10_01370 [Photorhabdus sp. HUG-39]|uniref:Arc family DNA-binding protein n=1 Tax=Photorhabdus kayaii TaxID=230088 RepID=A0ABX0B066_9GAMM|nr:MULTISPECIES: Arc family DNA-binding protein [Photorhabdus]MCC8375902.1 Arc family DNA-binding protein [Photorhabdus bodei]NDL10218.1 Arc family DNA-binding protein [Photorhabdus kayaii]NDL23907.1 Arc family DNA-binding protein [Photorhabdus kayaii]RAX12504.1 hypothetical protein CKY10_01370 [Photorhabdus sp. HUG-39]
MIGARKMPQFNIRIPIEFRDAIKNMSLKNGRSMNSEIVQALKDYIIKNSEAPTAGTVRASNLSKTEEGI